MKPTLKLLARLIKPIKTLTETSKQIASDDLSKIISVNSKDEIGQLGLAFNNMADKLPEPYQGLEQKEIEKNKQLAQKIKEIEIAKAKDEAILNSIIDGMIVTDVNGNVMLINALAKQLLGIAIHNVIGQSIFYLTQFYNEEGQIVAKKNFPLSISLTYGQKWETDVVVNLVDGKKRIIRMSSTVIVENNARVGGIVILRDITKEKEVDRMKTEFISLASHQLRTPLSAIKWFTEMLIGGDAGELNSEQQEFAKNISDSTERMIQLVNSLLNISRIESGRIIIDPRLTDLKELVSGIINDLKAKTQEKKQNLIISVHDDLPKINLDPKLIGQVYMNLLTNAIKYTPTGGDIQVFISKKGDQIISQVSDTGYGIPKEEQSKIFQKFFRADNIVKIETDGTGLGLYLVKSIVESSGGKVWYQSEEGKGSTFWFSLPLSGMVAKAGEVTLDA
ncbi:HAMP domain-containing protein [Candidatus Daviesbacteria bacterium]|nr:HAMP domain-containing protein [Candidatus Daviesbacteria bacterium]